MRYLESEFLGHATAADLLTHFEDGIRQLAPPGIYGWTQCELEVLHWSGMRTQNTGTPRTSEAEKSWNGNSLNCHGKVMELYYQISVRTLK